MSAATQFHALTVKRVDAEAGGAISVTFTVTTNLREVFTFTPGQFLTLRATIDGQDTRRRNQKIPNYTVYCTSNFYGL